MATENKLVAQPRLPKGSGAARRLRREGVLPAVVSNEKGESRSVQLSRHAFEMMLHGHRSENLILDLEVEGEQPKKMLLKDVQHDVISGAAVHADFVEISMTKKMRVNVTIRLVGEAVGVSQDGGILDQALRSVEVECLPTDLVEEILLDVTPLKIGDTFHVRSITVPPGLTVLTPGDYPVAAVTAPRAEEEVKPEGEEAAPSEPEVIGAKKEEGEEGEAGEEEEKKEGKADARKSEAKKPEAKKSEAKKPEAKKSDGKK